MKSYIKLNYPKNILVKLFICFVFIVSCSSSDDTAPTPQPTNQTPTETPELQLPTANIDSSMPGIGEARDISSAELVSEMGVGWNLGNSFDVISKDKTFWGNPLPNENIINTVYTMGFRSLRIPVTWGFHQSEEAPYQIELGYLERVQKVVDYGLANNMHVIIDVHHDNDWAKPAASEAEIAKKRLASLWKQVATYFKAYDESLLFEVLNEPRVEKSPEEWSGGTTEGRKIVNDFLKVSVDAIRATGGNNTKRHLMVPTWAASTTDNAMNGLVIPNNDPKIIVSLHTYFPYTFALNGSGVWGSDQDKSNLIAEFDRIRQKWTIEEKRTVILGEWGAVKSNQLPIRIEYAEFYATEAAKKGFLTFLWDDGGDFRQLNRNALSWDSEALVKKIIENSNR